MKYELTNFLKFLISQYLHYLEFPMKWPPTLCYTAPYTKNGNRHFQVKSFGGKKNNRWVELFATRDKELLIKISWQDLKLNWASGWKILPKENS